MRIAYMIAAHTDAAQLRRLVMSLNETDRDFFIHIDKKSNLQPFLDTVNLPNVHFLQHRVRTNWGGYSQCEYQMELMKAVIESQNTYDRVFFLSGLDYPLWSNSRIIGYLEQNPNKELIMGMNLSDCYEPRKMQTRVRQYHFRDLPFTNHFVKRIVYGVVRETLELLRIRKKNYITVGQELHKVYCGSSWWCLTGECMSFVYKSMCHIKAYQRYFKTCLASDEMFVQTIIFNSQYAKNAILHEGCYPGLVGLTPLHYIEYDQEIHVFCEKDYEKLILSDKMFVRKVRSNVSDKLICKIDKYRKGKTE